jgi:amidase
VSGKDECFKTILAVSKDIAEGATSSRKITETLLERIMGEGAARRGYALVMWDSALDRAEQADREVAQGMHRGPLHGIPIAIKDLVSIAGQVTACGMPMLSDWKPDVDATIVARLKRAGAVIIGKTQMTEGASVSHHPAITVPLNPWNAAYSSGFSSSGSGVAVAAGLAYAAIGSDTGGSIRIPSAMNGVTGLKPTWGRVSRYGVFPAIEYMDTLGPMARSAADCAAVLATVAGPDPADLTSHPSPPPNYLLTIESGVAGKTIGYDRELITSSCAPEVGAVVDQAAALLADLGARIVPIAWPPFDIGKSMAMAVVGFADAHRATYPERAAEYGPEITRLLETARGISGMEVAAGINAANAFRGQLQSLFESIDLLLMPTLTIPTPEVGVLERCLTGDADRMAPLRFALPFNVSGSPTITLPGGFDDRGMPISFQLVGRHFDEAALLEAGHAFQRVTAWHLHRPPVG